MNLEGIKRRALQSWISVGFLAALCLILAVLQYRWIGEVSVAERARLQETLNVSLSRIAQDFNFEVYQLASSLRASDADIDAHGREQAYADRYAEWAEGANTAIARRIAIAIPNRGELDLKLLDPDARLFAAAPWPAEWERLRSTLIQRLNRSFSGPPNTGHAALIEVPRFGRPGQDPPGEQDWLIIELNLDFVRSQLIPRLISRHLGSPQQYRVLVSTRSGESPIVYNSDGIQASPPQGEPDASVGLLDLSSFIGRRGGGGGPGGMKGGMKKGPPAFAGGQPPPGSPGDTGRGMWRMEVRYAGDSLDAIVARLRWRNISISGAILALMLITASLLVRFSRQQQQLADQQMNFVAGVSHELRTPLTVIRTAAYNLRGRLSGNPAQVERYGKLVQEEAEKLTALVEQVLRFSSARAGHVIREKSPVAVDSFIEEGVRSSRLAHDGSSIELERDLAEDLPLVLGDEVALRHAVQNLVDNAVKYGTENHKWIGISARALETKTGEAVEIRVADRGPGIPPEEINDIFDPFVRGRRAITDQIHGTGLGLNLVKRIVEAHGGTIRVESRPMERTEFIIRIPAAPAEYQDEFAHTAG